MEEQLLPDTLEDMIAVGLDINQLPQFVQDAIALGLDLPNIPPPPGILAGDFLASPAVANGGTQGMVVTSIRTNPELFDLFSTLEQKNTMLFQLRRDTFFRKSNFSFTIFIVRTLPFKSSCKDGKTRSKLLKFKAV